MAVLSGILGVLGVFNKTYGTMINADKEKNNKFKTIKSAFMPLLYAKNADKESGMIPHFIFYSSKKHVGYPCVRSASLFQRVLLPFLSRLPFAGR
jgi:hypothetical protein